jgi:hypothetical protein
MAATKRFEFAIHAPPNPYQGEGAERNILLYLIGENIHGPLSVFDVCLRATHLRGHANEQQVATCLQSVLVNYHWLDGELSKSAAQRDIERATGEPMTIGRRHGKRG